MTDIPYTWLYKKTFTFALDNVKVCVGNHMREDPYETHLLGIKKYSLKYENYEGNFRKWDMFSMDAEVAIFYDEGFLDAHHDASPPLFNEYAEDVEHEINSRTSDLFQR